MTTKGISSIFHLIQKLKKFSSPRYPLLISLLVSHYFFLSFFPILISISFPKSCITSASTARPDSALTIGTLNSAITGISTVGRSKKRMTGKERKRAAQKARKKLVKEMDQNLERSESRAGSLTRPGSRTGPGIDPIELNAKLAGKEFQMDQLSQKLDGKLRISLLLIFEPVFLTKYRLSNIGVIIRPMNVPVFQDFFGKIFPSEIGV